MPQNGASSSQTKSSSKGSSSSSSRRSGSIVGSSVIKRFRTPYRRFMGLVLGGYLANEPVYRVPHQNRQFYRNEQDGHSDDGADRKHS